MLLSAVPCPGEPGKGAKERPDPGKQPVLPASTRCQRWEAGKVMHGLPTSAASRGLPRRSPGCCPAGVRRARGAPGRLPALHPPVSAPSLDLGVAPAQGKGVWGLHHPLNLWCSGLVHHVPLSAASISSLPHCRVLPGSLAALSRCSAAQRP